jgi:hypothetical protein
MPERKLEPEFEKPLEQGRLLKAFGKAYDQDGSRYYDAAS